MDLRELGDPGVSHLGDVWSRLADESGEEFLVRGRPGDLLHDDIDARILLLELGDHLRDDFTFAAESPQLEALARGGVIRARDEEE
jgi:hypothetical protein